MNNAYHSFKERNVIYIAALLLIIFITSGLLVVEWTENRRFLENQRRSVIEQLSTIRARLEGDLNAELLLARSIIIEVSTNTNITKDRFHRIARHFFKTSKHIRNIGLAKGTILTYVHPEKGNEEAIGLDYKKVTSQWGAVQQVIEERKTVVAGPLNLVQGGIGIIGRTPIFIDNTSSGLGEYFGLLSVVINIPSLFEAAGLDDKDSLLKISIRGKDGLGAKGKVFYGSKDLFTNDPVLMEVTLPGGEWLMASVPMIGWESNSPRILYYRLVAIAVGLVILILLFIQQREMNKRKQAEKKIQSSLKEKETLLQEIHHRVKNSMTVISSLLGLQMSNTDNQIAKEVLQDSQNRVQSMSMIHETLYRSDNLSAIDLKTYLTELGGIIFQNYSISNKVQFKVKAEKIMISVKQASPIGLIVNELIANSLKYAFSDNREGEILLELKSNKQDSAELSVSDNGVGIPESFDLQNANSLGLKLIKLLTENQLDGSINMESNIGTKFTIKFNIET
jgi:two-component sensor histidine kinase